MNRNLLNPLPGIFNPSLQIKYLFSIEVKVRYFTLSKNYTYKVMSLVKNKFEIVRQRTFKQCYKMVFTKVHDGTHFEMWDTLEEHQNCFYSCSLPHTLKECCETGFIYWIFFI
jgi:hypothetical protein